MPISEIALIAGAILFFLAGLGGCIIPAVPGPPLGFIGLLLLHFTQRCEFTTGFLVLFGIGAVVVSVIDNLLPVWGTRKLGGSKRGILGATAGLIAGFFFLPPFGIIILPFAGALLGELTVGTNLSRAIKSSLGSVLGFLAGTVLKLITIGLMLFYFIKELGAPL